MNTTRILLSLALLSMGSQVYAAPPQAVKPAAVLSRTVTFDIPAQSLSSALLQFSTQSGVEFTVATKALEGRRVAAIRGTYATDRALTLLLANTGLKFETVNDGTVAIRSERDTGVNTSTGTRALGVEEVHLARIAGPQTTVALAVPAAPDEEDQTEMEVTGSRIRGNAENGAHPVVTYTQEDLQRFGITSIADIKRLIPQLGGSNKTDGTGVAGRLQNNTGAQPSAADARVTASLRGLPNNSTLILVDGKRLSRTGQSSGADNYDFGGIPLSAIDRIEVLSAGASAVYGADAIAGAINLILKEKFSGTEVNAAYDATEDGGGAIRSISLSPTFSRGNFKGLASFSYLEQNQLKATDRWFTANDDKRSIGGPAPNFQLTGGRGTVSSVIPPFPQANLPGLSTPSATIPAGANGQSATVGNYAASGPVPGLLNNAEYTNLISPRDEASAMVKVAYSLAQATELYADGRWSQRYNHDIRTAPIYLFATVPAGYPGNPFGVPVSVAKALFDTPEEFMEQSMRLRDWGGTAGVRGDFLGDWRYDVSTHWTRSKQDDNRYGLGTAGLIAAISDPNPANRPNLLDDSTSGASPISLQQYLGWASAFPSSEVSDNFVYSAQVNGSLFTLPSGAVKAAFTAEYTDEQDKFLAVPADSSSFNAQITDNSRWVRSLIGEVRIPLAPEERFPLVHRLEAGVQARHDTYSDFGSNLSPGYSLLYAPVNWLTLRGSTSKGFKVPSLLDLKGPSFNSGVFILPTAPITDPTNGLQVSGFYPALYSSNPNLNPEKSRSINFGAVANFRGLTVSIDRFDIDFTDRSSRPSVEDIFTFFPQLAIRNSSGVVTSFNLAAVNFARLRAKGLDYRVAYDLATDKGNILFQFSYSDAEPTSNQSTPSAAVIIQDVPDRGTASIFWSRGAWEAGVNTHYQSMYRRTNSTRIWSSELGYDPQVSYRFESAAGFSANSPSGWMRMLADTRISLTVFNAIYKEVSTAEAAFNSWVLDPRLRRYSLNIGKNF